MSSGARGRARAEAEGVLRGRAEAEAEGQKPMGRMRTWRHRAAFGGDLGLRVLYLGREEQPPPRRMPTPRQSRGGSVAQRATGRPLVRQHALYDLVPKHLSQPRRPLPPDSTGRRIPRRRRPCACRAFDRLKRLDWLAMSRGTTLLLPVVYAQHCQGQVFACGLKR